MFYGASQSREIIRGAGLLQESVVRTPLKLVQEILLSVNATHLCIFQPCIWLAIETFGYCPV